MDLLSPIHGQPSSGSEAKSGMAKSVDAFGSSPSKLLSLPESISTLPYLPVMFPSEWSTLPHPPEPPDPPDPPDRSRLSRQSLSSLVFILVSCYCGKGLITAVCRLFVGISRVFSSPSWQSEGPKYEDIISPVIWVLWFSFGSELTICLMVFRVADLLQSSSDCKSVTSAVVANSLATRKLIISPIFPLSLSGVVAFEDLVKCMGLHLVIDHL